MVSASTSTPSSEPRPRRWWRTSSVLALRRHHAPLLLLCSPMFVDTCWASEAAASLIPTPANTSPKTGQSRSSLMTPTCVTACSSWSRRHTVKTFRQIYGKKTGSCGCQNFTVKNTVAKFFRFYYGGRESSTCCNLRKHMQIEKHLQINKTSSSVWQHMCCKYSQHKHKQRAACSTDHNRGHYPSSSKST